MNKLLMKFTFFTLLFFIADVDVAVAQQDKECYLFTYFSDADQSAGLHLAYSHDGLHWKALNQGKPLLKPEVGNQKILRDPSITQGPDGTFHFVWTCSWADKGIGYAHSKDLIHWSSQRYLPVMVDEKETQYCWAPEIFYDDSTDRFYIIWASTVTGKHDPVPHTEDEAYNNPRQYVTSTQDFQTFTPSTKLYDKGFAVIDAFPFKEGDTYYLFIKNENSLPAEKNIRISTANSILGPYSEPSTPITSKSYWAEGASCLKVGDTYYLYYDRYKGEKGYGAKKSKDLKNWSDVTEQLQVPEGMKHGTPFKVSQKILNQLLQLE